MNNLPETVKELDSNFKMKDSGIQWIGEIPEHWELKPLKYLITMKGGGTPNTETTEFWNGSIPWVSPKDMKFDVISQTEDYITEEGLKNSTTNLIPEGSLLIVFRSGILQRTIPIGINNIPVALNQDVKSLTSKSSSYNIQSLYWFIKGNEVNLLSEWSKRGVTVESLETEYVNNFSVPVAPLDEQTQISQYLSIKTEIINLLIEKTQRKIDLLKEQQTATINHYVTKGLDPTVKMKDSGIDWIGEIPEHWKVVKLKYLVKLVAGRDPSSIYDDDGQYDVLGTGGVIGKTNEFMCDEISLIVGRKGTIDKPFIQKIPFWISDVVYYILPTSYISPNYYWYLFSQLDFSYYKYGSTMPSMSRDDYENMKFPIPPVQDLAKIEKALNTSFEKIKKILVKNEERIELLKEYRQSLISNVVTGKARVTEAML